MRELIRSYLGPAVVLILVVCVVTVYDLNAPIYDGRVSAKVLRMAASSDQHQIGTEVWIELEDGRVAKIYLPTAAEVPTAGTKILVSHFNRRFFGDGFSFQ